MPTTTGAPRVRIAFLGCGFITGVHSKHLRSLGDLVECSYASRDGAKAEAVPEQVRRPGGVRLLRGGDRGPGRRRGRGRRTAQAPPRADRGRDRRREARAGGEAGVPRGQRTTSGWPPCATRPGVTVLVGENDHYKPLAVTLRRLLARRRDRRAGDGQRRHRRGPAQARGRLAQRRDDGRRRRVLRGGHPLAAPRRQPRPPDRARLRPPAGRRQRPLRHHRPAPPQHGGGLRLRHRRRGHARLLARDPLAAARAAHSPSSTAARA